MQPEKIAALDPHYAHDTGIRSDEIISNLNEVTTRFDALVASQGQQIDEMSYPILGYVRQYLALDRDYEAFFKARILPPHDTFAEDSSQSSRFLVVDSRNSYDEDAGNVNPSLRIRAYFLLIGEDVKDEGDAIFPFYVVNERETTGGNQDNNQATHIFYSRLSGWPLDIGINPERIHETGPYEEMASEMNLALARLSMLYQDEQNTQYP